MKVFQKVFRRITNIFKKHLNKNVLGLIQALTLNEQQSLEIKPFVKKIKKSIFESEDIINFYHLLVKYGFKRDAQKLLYYYLNIQYNDQHAITLLEESYRLEHEKRTLEKWYKLGRPVPVPHIVKQNLIRGFAKRYNTEILVETGTCFGYMIEALRNEFKQIYSIELSKKLYEKACKRFENYKNIKLFNGDSGLEIKAVLAEISTPALFFLDGHYSGDFTAKGKNETPIFEELEHVLQSPISHTLIIDDARLFGQDPAYPSVAELTDFINKRKPHLEITIDSDSIIVTPQLS